jgi:hypothetical protein
VISQTSFVFFQENKSIIKTSFLKKIGENDEPKKKRNEIKGESKAV